MGLSGKEKFSYGLGAVGKDMVYMLSASYILYYYQDILFRRERRSHGYHSAGCKSVRCV